MVFMIRSNVTYLQAKIILKEEHRESLNVAKLFAKWCLRIKTICRINSLGFTNGTIFREIQ